MKQTLLAILILTIACRSAMQTIESSSDKSRNSLIGILGTDSTLRSFIENKDSLNIQIIYTKIDRNKDNEPHFTDYTFNVDHDTYFYPASTVKMPIAFFALEKMNNLREKGIDMYTTMITDSSFKGEEVVYTQPTAEDGKASVAHYIKQIFLVSDNDASNRLYEFLGQEYLYNQLLKKELNHSIIRHRLAVVLSQEQNRHTNPVSFYDTAGNILYEQPAQYSHAVFPSKNVKLGKGYYSSGKLVNEPFDFSLKNNVALSDLHQSLRSFLFPGVVSKHHRFNIAEADRQFVLKCMSSYPRESNYPYYDSTAYPDNYAKFFGGKILPNNNIRIFSKAGWAYGFLTDVAYIVDFEKGIEFMLSATILCNSDGVFNDNKYDFDTVGYPFMQTLGKAVYQHELQRQRKHQPNLAEFKLTYTQK